jgi:hypothetical protein
MTIQNPMNHGKALAAIAEQSEREADLRAQLTTATEQIAECKAQLTQTAKDWIAAEQRLAEVEAERDMVVEQRQRFRVLSVELSDQIAALRAEQERLREALEAQADPCVWRDIASAPKDGTELLLLEGRRVVSGAWNSGGAFHMPHWMGGNYHPTHWMFIPSDHLQVAKPCVWREVDSHYGLWSPACVNSAEALHNSWKYCPYCSHPLQVQR